MKVKSQETHTVNSISLKFLKLSKHLVSSNAFQIWFALTDLHAGFAA